MTPFPQPRWWQELRENPIYVRERGGWGKPNPFYDKLSRFSPFVVLGAILLGFCGTGWNMGLLGNDGLFAFWFAFCIPAFLLNALTLFGSLMAPALTAPAISMEMNRGTWEILRVTPLSMRTILMAKLLGALSRLRIWPALFALSLLQGILFAAGAMFMDGSMGLTGLLLGIATAVRPWLEVLFAGFTGMVVSTHVHSTTTALAASYALVISFKIINSSGVWMGVFGLFEQNEAIFLAGSVGPAVTYTVLLASLWLGLMKQADRLNYE